MSNIISQQINKVLFLLHSRNEPVSLYEICAKTESDAIMISNVIEGLKIVDATGNSTLSQKKYSLTYEARAAIDFLPEKYKDNPYEYFLNRKPTRHPNKEHATHKVAIFQNGTLIKIVNNPWVITIVGGLILALLAKVFGLL